MIHINIGKRTIWAWNLELHFVLFGEILISDICLTWSLYYQKIFMHSTDILIKFLVCVLSCGAFKDQKLGHIQLNLGGQHKI